MHAAVRFPARLSRPIAALACAMALVVGAGGCSDSGGIRFPDPDAPKDAVVGAIDPDGTGFSVNVNRAWTPLGPIEVELSANGRDVRYNGGYRLLLVDIYLANGSGFPLQRPVTLTFRDIQPDTVVMWDPPNADLTWEVPFDNDYPMWSSSWISEPLTVGFRVGRDVPVSFVADIGVEYGPPDGGISGLVWEDLDRDGSRGPAEPGAAGVPVRLDLVGGDLTAATISGPDGAYRFDRLPRGAYEVAVEPAAYLSPTTAVSLPCTLAVTTAGVDTLGAWDFGVTYVPVDTLRLPAAADASVPAAYRTDLSDNHGADPYLILGASGVFHDDFRGHTALVRFSPPLGLGPVQSARLEMTVADYPDGYSTDYELTLHPVIPSGTRTPWIEGCGSSEGTWLDGVEYPQVAPGVALLGVENGGDAENHGLPDFEAAPVAALSLPIGTVPVGAVIGWDVTGLVNSWLDGTRPNLGIAVRDTSAPDYFRRMRVWSRDALLRDYGVGTPGPGPRLVLTY